MGKWAVSGFNTEETGKIGVVVAGAISKEIEKQSVALFDKVNSFCDTVIHGYVAEKNKELYSIAFNVYGASSMVDTLTIMHDGGCQTAIFIGYAFGFANLSIASIVVPDRSYHFDGIYQFIKPERKYGSPDKLATESLSKILTANNVDYKTGYNISVPSVSLQLPHNNDEYKRIKPTTLEMELAAFYSRAKDLGLRGTGILVISDNETKMLTDSESIKKRRTTYADIIKIVINNLEYFQISPLDNHSQFDMDKYAGETVKAK